MVSNWNDDSNKINQLCLFPWSEKHTISSFLPATKDDASHPIKVTWIILVVSESTGLSIGYVPGTAVLKMQVMHYHVSFTSSSTIILPLFLTGGSVRRYEEMSSA